MMNDNLQRSFQSLDPAAPEQDRFAKINFWIPRLLENYTSTRQTPNVNIPNS